VLKIGGAHPGTDGKGEEIDDFTGPAPENMSAQNVVCAFFNEHFVTGICFRNTPRRIPGRGHLRLDSELEVLLTCPVFTETNSSKRRDREDNRRNAKVIWFLMVSLQDVCGHDQPFIARNRGQREASTRGSISRRIDSWDGYTLQEIVDSNSSLLPFDPRSIEIQVADLGHATRGMHNHIRLKRVRLPRGQRPNNQLSGALFDPCRFGFEMKVYAKFASSLDKLINEIRVKKGKWTRATMENGYLRSRKRRYMCKLEGNIPTSDKEKPSREFVQLQELIACRKVLSAGNPQICWRLPSRNNDVSSLQSLLPYLHCRWTGESRPSMERCDAGFREIVFAPFCNGLSERAFETH
jgi:hypothetical protein